MISNSVMISHAEESVGFALWRAHFAWQRTVNTALQRMELTHVQFLLMSAIWWLHNHEEDVTQIRLAEYTGSDQMTTSQVVRNLADRGLVRRTIHPLDARARLLVLTRDGNKLIYRAARAVEKAEEDFFHSIGDMDSRMVKSFTRQLRLLSNPPVSEDNQE